MALHPVPIVNSRAAATGADSAKAATTTQWRAGLHVKSEMAAMSHEIGFGLVEGTGERGMGKNPTRPSRRLEHTVRAISCCSERAVRIADESD